MGVHKYIFFPTQAAQHWSLLVYSTSDQELHSLDSGRTKLFAHTDMHYAPAIGQIENLVRSGSTPPSDVLLTRSPKRLPVTVQPNGIDCGFHVLFNAKSLAMHVNEGSDIATWEPPATGVRRP